MSPEQSQAMTIVVKAINGPLMFFMLVVNIVAVAALWKITKVLKRLVDIYDTQVNGEDIEEDEESSGQDDLR